MKTDVVVQTTALTKGNVNHSLREGSSVLVRILKNNGNNSYKVAFAGRQFNITSELKLEEGTALLAKIKLEGGKILLQKLEQAEAFSNSLEKISTETGQDGKLTNPAAITFFKKLGLIPDSLSYSMFQQMKQLGLAFNLEKFKEVRKVSERFIGKEKEAAQIAMILEQKGLNPDFESIWEILEKEYSENPVFEDNHNSESDEEKFCRFFEGLLNGLSMNDTNKAGFLTLFNHCGFKHGKSESSGSWIKIPFEFSYNSRDGRKSGSGNICSFFEKDVIFLKKCCINLNFPISKFCFVLYFTCKKCSKITVSFPRHYSIEEKNNFLLKMKSLFSDIELDAMDSEETSQFYAENSEILAFRGMA